MKTHSIPPCRALGSAVLALVLSLALAPGSQAKDKGHGNSGHGGGGKHEAPGQQKHEPKFEHKAEQKFEHKFEPKQMQKFEHKMEPRHEQKFAPKLEKKFEPKVVVVKPPHHDERRRVAYMAFPRSGFVLSPGIGYAGRGYYYGPPNSPYYYENPEVRYFSRREDFPSGYAFQPNNQYAADELAVQEALARLGYYQGPIDGRIGPQTLAAIARYQQDRGMPITNAIVPALLQALGLQ